MSAPANTDQDTVHQIVRGERPLADLRLVGMSLRRSGDAWAVENPRGVSAVVGVPDLARGLLAHRSDPEALRAWAMFIQASDLDLDVEGRPGGELVLAAVWDAAFANPPGEELARKLERLGRGDGE